MVANQPAVLAGVLDIVSDEVAEQLLATLREALSNVSRHAAATSTEISLEAGDRLTLRVTDNGVGISDTVPKGNGLHNMATRAERLGGRCSVSNADGGGATLEWSVPNPTD